MLTHEETHTDTVYNTHSVVTLKKQLDKWEFRKLEIVA